MPEVNNANNGIYWLIGLFSVMILAFLMMLLTVVLNDFARELKYLNNEIDRTQGKERQYWLRRRRRLWLSLIPFVKY